MTTKESEVDVLLPCPFCGSRDVRVAGVSGAYVMCTPCGAEGPYGDFTDEQAIAAWNNRPPSPKEPEMNTTTNTRGVSEAMVTHQDAAKALDSLDDYARMGTGVDAHGPRGVLERYIAQQSAACAPTYRREEAVKALIGKGWTWDGKAWAEPAAQGEAVACRYRFHNGRGGWFGWLYSDTPTRKFVEGDRVQCEPLFTAPPAQPAERCNGQFCEHCEPEHGCKPRKAAERVPEGWILRASNLLRDLEFSALGGRRCPCCLGWTSENGENDRRHTETCELASLIAATPAAPADGKEGVR